MPAQPPADPPGRPNDRPRRRDRHGRHQPRNTSTASGPRHILGPPKTIPYGADEYERAVHAWAVLIAAWLTDHPPADDTETWQDRGTWRPGTGQEPAARRPAP